MALKNIELFDLYVGKIFVELYEHFPIRTTLSPCDMTGMEVDEEALDHPKQCYIFHDTMVWLQESGYVKYAKGDIYAFHDVVLTARGLELLKAVPDSVQSKSGIGDKLSFIAKKGGDEALKNMVNTLLSMGVRMFG
ncbi:MAG: hypothetical protein PHV10_07785 [Sulfuricurvum sp.]|nr:hypothetical protein [Sulfuricurvum sp.]